MLIDSDVLIFYMRRNSNAEKILLELDKINISAVTYMEIIQGVKNKQELINFDKTLGQWDVTIYPITKTISYDAMNLVKTYSLSHSLYLADALIASTAIHHQLPLLSANTKHYRMLEQLDLVTFKP